MVFIEDAFHHILKHVVSPDASQREGLIEVIKQASRGEPIILSAPPGYGKTTIVYTLGYLAANHGFELPRTIHILPLRSIIDDCYSRLFENGKTKIPDLSREAIGRQMMGTHESPWLQKPLVFTTIDTFILCSLKLPPREIPKISLERSLGHGSYTKAAIMASLPIFDEIQLFIEESTKLTAVTAALIEWMNILKNLDCRNRQMN